MDDYSQEDELKFVESLYDGANENLKDVYKEQKQNRDNLLKEIADVMLTYIVADAVMNLSKEERSKLSEKFLDLITKNAKSQGVITEKVTNQILNNTVYDTFKFYSYNAGLKDVEKIINNNYKGKHFSTRVWDNEKEVAKYLHKQTQDFLQGKVNVNQIKKKIQDTYNNNSYEVRRLVETEVSRCQNEAFDRFCIETYVRKVKYNAVLEACEKCKPLNGNIYDFNKKPELPRHPLCRCFYEIADGEKKNKEPLVMDLQLFGIDEKQELEKMISSGIINKEEYDKCYNYFKNSFKNGVDTPIGKVDDKGDRYIHIARRHTYMISFKEIDNIVKSLQSPDVIYKTKDKFGSEGIGYIKNIGNNELLTIVKDGIITSYYPNKNYLEKTKRGEIIWQKK